MSGVQSKHDLKVKMYGVQSKHDLKVKMYGVQSKHDLNRSKLGNHPCACEGCICKEGDREFMTPLPLPDNTFLCLHASGCPASGQKCQIRTFFAASARDLIILFELALDKNDFAGAAILLQSFLEEMEKDLATCKEILKKVFGKKSDLCTSQFEKVKIRYHDVAVMVLRGTSEEVKLYLKGLKEAVQRYHRICAYVYRAYEKKLVIPKNDNPSASVPATVVPATVVPATVPTTVPVLSVPMKSCMKKTGTPVPPKRVAFGKKVQVRMISNNDMIKEKEKLEKELAILAAELESTKK
jgi:hypothetical protein